MCLRLSRAKVDRVCFGPVFGPLQLYEYAGHGRERQWHRDGRRWRRRDHNRDLFSVVVWCDMEQGRTGCNRGGGRHICIRAEFGPGVFLGALHPDHTLITRFTLVHTPSPYKQSSPACSVDGDPAQHDAATEPSGSRLPQEPNPVHSTSSFFSFLALLGCLFLPATRSSPASVLFRPNILS